MTQRCQIVESLQLGEGEAVLCTIDFCMCFKTPTLKKEKKEQMHDLELVSQTRPNPECMLVTSSNPNSINYCDLGHRQVIFLFYSIPKAKAANFAKTLKWSHNFLKGTTALPISTFEGLLTLSLPQ